MRRGVLPFCLLLLLGPGSGRAAARWGDLLCYDFVVEGRIARYANGRDVLCGDGYGGCVAVEALVRTDRVLAGRSAPDRFWATTIIREEATPRARLVLFVTRDDDGRYYVVDTDFVNNEKVDVAGRSKLGEISPAVKCPAA
jgi:hypothetical protein